VVETDASLLDDLPSPVEPETRGDPQSPLLWTCKSLHQLSRSLRDMGHEIGRTLVGELLHKFNYRLQPIARPVRDRAIPIAMPNSITSTIVGRKRSRQANQRSQSIPKRRSLSATFATAGGNGSAGLARGSPLSDNPLFDEDSSGGNGTRRYWRDGTGSF
jgi:hypothetical protein